MGGCAAPAYLKKEAATLHLDVRRHSLQYGEKTWNHDLGCGLGHVAWGGGGR